MKSTPVRAARLSDASAITQVHCSTVETWYEPAQRQPRAYADLDLYGRWYNGGAWMSPELCAAHLNRLLLAGHLPLVAELEGQVVGEAEYYLNHEPGPFGPGLHLSVLYVHQRWQRRGVGRALVEAGIARAQAMGLALVSTQPEAEAQDFYRALGFEPWLRAREMQLATRSGDIHPRASTGVPETLTPHPNEIPAPANLALRIGRYQCGGQNWQLLWPGLAVPGIQGLYRRAWTGTLDGVPVALGLRGQVRDPTQVDGYAWLPPTAPLAPAVAALRALAAAHGFSAVDLLLPEDALEALKTKFKLHHQTDVALWRAPLSTSRTPPPASRGSP